MIRRLLRRIIKWALDEPSNDAGKIKMVDLTINLEHAAAAGIFVKGASSPDGRRVIVNTIRAAKINREL